MSSAAPAKFQDHYQLLGVGPNSSSEEVHKAYSTLAAKYHPTNRETRDQEKFKAVTLAYEVLSDPVARKAFNDLLPKQAEDRLEHFDAPAFFRDLSLEADRRSAILSLLYQRRRTHPLQPGLSYRQMEAVLKASNDELIFSMWYLKQRGLAVANDKSSMEITVEGMDYLEQHNPDPAKIMELMRAAD
jgi:curved DNA-binding protein CbpA